ncbi:MAG TPA: hypothetical protein VFL28_07455 [bacterium]|nr:hypothetical protein [bacterium]
MPVRQLSMVVIATLLIVSIVGIGVAQAQLDTGESYWGERMMNGIFNLWPAAAIAIFTALLAGGVFGLYELDRTSMLVLAAASAFLAYHFYWQPAHPASVQAPAHVMAVPPPGARDARASGYTSAVR